MKKILKNNSGMALITVLGIMLVISILATGLFYVTTNEFNFSQIEYDNTKAIYLARAGVEIASKSYDTVSGNFTNIDVNPVTATLYLKQDNTISSVESTPSNPTIGSVLIEITQEERELTIPGSTGDIEPQMVLVYRATANVDGVQGQAQGITLPAAYGNAKPSSNAPTRNYLYWVPENGEINHNITNASGARVYSESVPAGANGFINDFKSAFGWLFGITGDIPVYFTQHSGVVTIANDVMSGESMRVDKNGGAYAMVAPAIIVDVPIDMRRNTSISWFSSNVSVFSFVANTVVFNKEITIYSSNFAYQIGDIVLAPIIEGSTGVVYFNAPVYLVNANKKQIIIPAGSVFTFGAEVDGKTKGEPVNLFSYAAENGWLDGTLGGWLLKSKGDISTGGMQTLNNPPIENPNSNSLSEIIWE